MIVVRVLAVIAGLAIVQAVVRSAVRTVVVPQGEQVLLPRFVFLVNRSVYTRLSRRSGDAERSHRTFARFAPMSLMLLAGTWAALVIIGFTPVYWGITDLHLDGSLLLSGSSFTTLGFVAAPTNASAIVAFVEALVGLGLIALLIAFLPTIYGHFSRREAEVVKLEVRAGSPPSVGEMVTRFNRIRQTAALTATWADWEQWFVEVEESHTSQPSIALFRSQSATSSWVTAAGAVLDTAAFRLSVIDAPWDPQAALTIRAGFLCLRRVAGFYNVPFDPDPAPNDPISVTRAEFDELLDVLEGEGVPLRADREQAWRDWAGWRVNYDVPLIALCAITQAPTAPWSADRLDRFHPPTVRGLRLRRWRIDPCPNPSSW